MANLGLQARAFSRSGARNRETSKPVIAVLECLTERAALTLIDNEIIGSFVQKIVLTFLLSLQRWSRNSRSSYDLADLYGGRRTPCSLPGVCCALSAGFGPIAC